MSVMYNAQNVDEKYASILEPNLYYGAIFVPGVTCTDKYQIGPAGGIFVHKLSTSAVEVGKPGRDFVDEETKDELIPIVLNNNYQKSKKIYGVQAAAVAFPLAHENLSMAIQECKDGRELSGLGCLVQEATPATLTSEITVDGVKEDVVATRQEIVQDKGRANIVLCTPSYYSKVLLAAGKDFEPSRNDRIAATGNVGTWLGFTFIEAAAGAVATVKYYDHTGALKTVKLQDGTTRVEYVMYYAEAFSIVPNFETARLVDSENFVGTKAQVELNCGFRVTNSKLARVRKSTKASA